MDFRWDPATEALRAEVRAFVAEHLTPELEDRMHRSGVAHDPAFARRLAEQGWVATGGDEETLDAYAADVLAYELARADAPVYATATTAMVTRVIAAVGSPELQAEVLPPARRGELTIALGMSEPEAGSDVAAVRTRARRDGDGEGDGWVIDGQKMFTTNGHVADYVFLLTRTDPDSTRHRGLTTFLVPLDRPGVEAQAVYTLSGERTNITFYSDVHLEDRWRIGAVGAGWAALMLSLQDEHSVGFCAHLDRLLADVEAWAQAPPDPGEPPPITRPEVADRLARTATRLEVAQLLEARTTWMKATGTVPVAEGPMAKLFGTEALVAGAEDLAELVGPDGLRTRTDPAALRDGRIEHALRFSLGTTIYAGTSEIQRNLIAQHACGLPR